MASQAYKTHLLQLLQDVLDINKAHKSLRTGHRGRQWGLGGLNRSTVVIAVSAWEGYIEAVLLEAVEALKPAGPALGTWPALKAGARSEAGRLNTPNTDNVNRLFQSVLGLPKVSDGWQWVNCDPRKAETYLDDALANRHRVAHGVNPRPTIHNGYAEWLPLLFQRLGRCTDAKVSGDVLNLFGVSPWPVP